MTGAVGPPADTPSRRRAIIGSAAVFLALGAVFWSVFAPVRATIFEGFDEWFLHWVSRRGLVGCPYSNRPFNSLWTLPGSWITPDGFLGYHVAHATYLWLTGWCTYHIVRRVAPGDTVLAFLAGTLAAVWAPTDLTRLNSVTRTISSGFTLGMLLAAIAFLESWLRGSRALLACALLLAYVAVRGYEASLPLLLLTTTVVLLRGGGGSRALWSVSWLAMLATTAIEVVVAVVFRGGEPLYQLDVVGADLRLGPVLMRLARQYSAHLLLLPSARPSWEGLSAASAVVPAAVFLVSGVLVWRLFGRENDLPPARIAALGLGGFLLAGAAYLPFVLSAKGGYIYRTQFFSTPAIAVFLAAAVRLAAGALRPRWRAPAALLAGACLLALAGASTSAMLRAWEGFDFYPRQRTVLLQITQQAPDLEAGTLVLLIEERPRAFLATLSFRHATELLYPERATGLALGGWDYLYPTRIDRGGILTTPWASIQRSWGLRPTFHSAEQIVVFRHDGRGHVWLIEEWPPELATGLPGAGYAPRKRIRKLERPSPERALLIPPS